MAEECTVQPCSDDSPRSYQRTITLTLPSQSLEQDPFSVIFPVLDKPQLSPVQSPRSPRTNFDGCPFTDSILEDEDSTEKLILGDTNEGFGVSNEVASGNNEVSEVQLVKNRDFFEGFSDGVAVNLSVLKELRNFDGNGETSELLLKKDDEGFGRKDDIDEFPELNFAYMNEVSGAEWVKDSESFEGLSDEVGLSVEEDSGRLLEKDEVGISFDRKGEIDEFLELKDEVSGMGKANSSEVVHFGSSESQADGTLSEATSSKSRNWDESLKSGDHVAHSLAMEFIDETVVVGILDYVGKKSGTRGKKGDSGDVGPAGSLNGVKGKMKYSRKMMEKLRYVNVKAQKKFWQEVYNGFSDDVRNEYGELGSFKQNKQGKRKQSYQGVLGGSSSGNMTSDAEPRDSTHVTFDGESSGKYDEDYMEWSEDEKSDDEYQCIRRPAFMVHGEPDFESGPPEDGLEYLRRVRWEAARIPKVKVVKLNKSKVTEQSVYMPKIPDIEKCPPHLAPLKEWEEEFIADFSELRLALSSLGDTSDAASVDSDLIIFSRPECTKPTPKSPASLELPAGGPTVSTLIAMDPVTRAALLNRRITLFESASSLSKDDYAWLFALCAVVEIPLDADTSASLRCLLRRCAKMRAEKADFDDEVIMLNILATIAGKIFGQSEI